MVPGPTADGVGSEDLSFNMKQKLWTRAFVLALLRTGLDFFHGGMEGDRMTQSPASSVHGVVAEKRQIHTDY